MEGRRSALAVPGSSDRMLAKALSLEADEVVIDLEDAVARDQKDTARELVCTFLESAEPPAGTAIAVRVNQLASPWARRDVEELAARAGARIGSLVLPKVESRADVQAVAGWLEAAGAPAASIDIQALIETAAGLVHAVEIAASPRMASLILGYLDLAASLGRAPGPIAPERWLYAQETVLVAARAAGIQAIDGPYLEIRDDDGLAQRARLARELGFDGKWAVHPGQLAAINAAFTPGEDEVARARATLAALEEAGGRGAVELDGEMIDEASRKLALQVVARARVAARVKEAAR